MSRIRIYLGYTTNKRTEKGVKIWQGANRAKQRKPKDYLRMVYAGIKIQEIQNGRRRNNMESSVERPAWFQDNLHAYKDRYIYGHVLKGHYEKASNQISPKKRK